METIMGTEVASTIRRSQVYLATHKGEQTLPFMNRSFISFTYGGKKIEDFNLIATITNNRLNRKGYAPFEDTISTYSNLDGLYYWGTHYKANQLDFVLATDGIDLKDLDDFLYWFKAGTTRELILAEHPYRAILARVFEPPTLNLLPFLHEVTLNYSGIPYNITTTLYKGEINLSLVMDLPHWIGKVNILGEKKINETTGLKYYANIWKDPFTKEEVDIFASLDALKILYEDGIPLGSMIKDNMLLGDKTYAEVEDTAEVKIWKIGDENECDDMRPDLYTNGSGARISGTVTNSPYPRPWPTLTYTLFMNTAAELLPAGSTEEEIIAKAKELWLADENYKNIYWLIPNGEYQGRIAGAIVTVGGNGIDHLDPLNPDDPKEYGYFFYSGTAPSPIELSFTMTPIIDAETCYLLSPYNHITEKIEEIKKKYNTITIESVHRQLFRLTTPNLFTSYNEAVKIFDTLIDGSTTWEIIRTAICNKVRHPVVRAWALKCIEYRLRQLGTPNDNNIIASHPVEGLETVPLKLYMRQLLVDEDGIPFDVSFKFDSNTGLAIGNFKYNTLPNMPLDASDWKTNSIIIVQEDVGDMLRSNHIIILDRNYPTDEGTIIGWTGNPDINGKYTHRISHDIQDGIDNIQIIYKNRYL